MDLDKPNNGRIERYLKDISNGRNFYSPIFNNFMKTLYED